MKKEKIALTLGLVCFFLTIGISVQLKTIATTTSAITSNSTENKLRDEVFKWSDKYESIYRELEDAEKTLEA